MIIGAFFGLIGLFVYPESYAPVLLQRRAKKLRYETRNWALHAQADENQVDFRQLAQKYILRPFAMLFLEPILLLVTLYMGFIYGILYLFFEVYPISFQEERMWNAGVGALPFLSISVGVVLGGLLITYTTKTRFARKLKEHGKVIPEERLIPMIIGGAVFPAGLFWFAWTSNPNILWVPQVLAGIPIGMGILVICKSHQHTCLFDATVADTENSLARLKLHHRLLRHERQLRHRRQHLLPFLARCWLSHVCHGHVP